ncbi:MAG: response regulator [Planctomycetota bacterium]|jgi:DNA-binding NtrC family response regulator|nr:response regulator [Planctomycetota bacterium]
MADILVGLADEAERERVTADLRGRGHDVSLIPPVAVADNPKNAAEAVLRAKAAVAVLDYLANDAASVKLLQNATERDDAPGFIFILPGAAPTMAHLLMAVNEGASAILEKPVNLELLANYVERAAAGPSRFRREAALNNIDPADLARLEKELNYLRTKLKANCKLISYLLSTPVASQRRTALVVSDSIYQRDSLRRLLEEHGFSVELAGNPEEGVAIAMEKRPRVVISDLEMAGRNGVEFCRDLKITHKLIPCHFVICTANSDNFDKIMAPGNGVDACIPKPANEIGSQILMAGAAMGLLLQE